MLLLTPTSLAAQSAGLPQSSDQQPELSTAEDWNKRLQELIQNAEPAPVPSAGEYRIGPYDLLKINIFQAPEMDGQVRVSASGDISLPLLGGVQAAGLTPKELEFVLQELLRRSYMKDPHVSVFVSEMQSHPVSVFGAVKTPGVFQIRGVRTLIEVLSLAEGLAEDAGETVIVMRGAGLQNGTPQDAAGAGTPSGSAPPLDRTALGPSPETTIEINLKALLETGEPQYNIPIYPGDIVKVTKAGIVYVVGAVKKQGGYILKTNENISVLQAVALAEGLKTSASKKRSAIIRTDENGERTEIPVDLGKVLAGKAPDPMLQPDDIVFVPDSLAKAAALKGIEAVVRTISGVIIFGGR
jgi:polysaccharide export outer membrane protein